MLKRLLAIFVVLTACIFFTSCQSLCSHDFESVISIAPGCESDGELTNTCSKCGYVETEVVSMTGHVFDEGTVTQEPECGVQGVRTYHCTGCEETKTEDIPALVHDYDDGAVTREPSCSEQGELTYTCAHCGDTKQEPIDMVSHTFGEGVVTKEATCKEEGEISTICEVCGFAEVVEQIAKTEDHIFEEIQVRAPTCVDKGEGKMVCTVCEYSESFEYDYGGHSFGEATILRYATCAENGEKQYICVHCAYSYTESIAKTEHSWGDGACGQPITCTACGYTDYNGRKHNYVFDSNLSPSGIFAGRTIYVCSNCGDIVNYYYGNTGDYDFDYIRSAVANYANNKGFQIVYSTQSGATYEELCSTGYSNWERAGGQSAMIKSGKEAVDRLYNTLINCNVVPEECTLLITVYAGQNTTFGTSFSIKLIAYKS